MHLVKGYCIKEGHGHNETKPNLPSKEFFITELFNHKNYLSEEDLESIAESLGIGKKSSDSTASSSSESHAGHNHRRRRSAASVVSSQEESAASHTLHRRAVDSHAHTDGGSGSVGVTLTSSPLFVPLQYISLFTLRVHSIGLIWTRISYLRSVRSLPIKEPTNPPWERIHWFFWSWPRAFQNNPIKLLRYLYKLSLIKLDCHPWDKAPPPIVFESLKSFWVQCVVQ